MWMQKEEALKLWLLEAAFEGGSRSPSPDVLLVPGWWIQAIIKDALVFLN